MDEEIRYRGKTFTAREIDEINEVIATNRERSRMFISQEICRRWGWRQPNGVLKDMICRGLLLRLEAQGLSFLLANRRLPILYLHAKSLPGSKWTRLLS